jgi:hypothetical protein
MDYEIAKPDLDKIDPDKDGLPGITAKSKEAQLRLNELATQLVVEPLGSPKWYDILYLLVLEWGVNLKYLNPVFAKLGGFGVIVNSMLVYGIKYMAKRSCVKPIDLKNPDNL